MAPLAEQAIEAELVAAAREGAPTPVHVYALFSDYPPAPALYGEFEVVVDGTATDVDVIVHNLRYYELGMEEWDVGLVELLVLNELHELTHWAMTPNERTALDTRSQRYHRADGYWLNPVILDIIDWLPGESESVVDIDDRTPLTRLRAWIRSFGFVR